MSNNKIISAGRGYGKTKLITDATKKREALLSEMPVGNARVYANNMLNFYKGHNDAERVEFWETVKSLI